MPQSKSKYEKIVEFVGELEKRYPVENWRVDGVAIWPLIRLPLAFGILAAEDFRPDNQISKYHGLCARLLQVAGALLRSVWVRFSDRKKNASLRHPADVIFLVSSTTRFYKIRGRWYTPYSDSFVPHLEAAGLRTLVLETTSDTHFRIPRYRSSVFIQGGLFLRQIATALAVRQSNIPTQLMRLEGLQQMLREVGDQYPSFGVPSVATIARRVLYVFWAADYFERIVRKAKAKVALNDGYYALEAMALQLACSRAGVESIEIQHGVQGQHHFAYREWTRIPQSGYELFPRRFWVWGEDERINTAKWTEGTAGRHSVMIGGNPVLHLVANPEDQQWFDSQTANADESGAVNILFTMQAFYSVPEFLLQAVESSPASWIWWFRAHPQYWETREQIRKILVQRNLMNRVLLDEASDSPMRVVLAKANVHITEFSSSVIEAEAVGVPSVVMAEQAKALYVNQFKRGTTVFADTAADLLHSIDRYAKRRDEGSRGSAEQAFLSGIQWLIRRAHE